MQGRPLSGESTRRPLLFVLAALVLSGLAGSDAFATPAPFVPGTPQNFTTRSSPRSVAAGDINNDGIQDMVVSASGGFSILLGQGGGAFAPKVDIGASAALGQVVLADFNLDGKLDLAAPFRHAAVPSIMVPAGNGDGTFGVLNTWSGPANADFITKADFNHDGRMDLATCGYATSAGTASVYLNNSTVGGAITFVRTDYAVGTRPQGIAAGYLKTSVEFPDIVTANTQAGTLSILKNDGTGHFGNRQDITAKASVWAVTVGAFFSDTDRQQIVTANRDSSSVSWIQTSNVDDTIWTRYEFPTAAGPRDVVVADADGDGQLEILVAASTGNQISILAINPNGFQNTTFLPSNDIAAGPTPLSVAVVNFNDDLKNDLLCTNQGGASATWTPGLIQTGWHHGDFIPGDFVAPNQFGNDTSFSGLRAGKWVLLDLCSNWCPPCRDMAGHTQDFFARWAGHPSVQFEYVTGLVDGQIPGVPSTQFDALQWSNTYRIKRPILHSGGLPLGGMQGVAQQSSMTVTPTLRLIDPQGQIHWYHEGAVAESTLARVLANAAGVAIPPPVSGPPAEFTDGALTVAHGNESVGMTWSPEGGAFDFLDYGFGENFYPTFFSVVRNASGLETWQLSMDYAHIGRSGTAWGALPTDDSWQYTISNMMLDPALRVPDNEGVATVTILDTLGLERNMPIVVPYTWSGGTLELDPIPAAALAAMPPIRTLTWTLLMQTDPLAVDVPGGFTNAAIALRAPWPNPARQGSVLSWSQPRAGTARLDVYDVRGRHVRTLTDGIVPAGEHMARWNLLDENGSRVDAGLYFGRVVVEGVGQATTRVTVLP